MRIGTVNSSEIGPNRDGDDNVRLLKVEITSPDDEQTVEWIQAAGIDFTPAVDTAVVVDDLGQAWKIAYAADDGIEPETAEGEYQIYSYANGVKKAKIWLYNDGKIRIENDNGYAELSAAGQLNVNGNFTVDP